MVAILIALATQTAVVLAAGKPGGGGVPNPLNLRVTPQIFRRTSWSGVRLPLRLPVTRWPTASSPTEPTLGAAVDVGKVLLYWVPDITPLTTYKFKVWSYDRKGNMSSGVTVTGTTKSLPASCLSYARHNGHRLSHGTYDPIGDRVYATGLDGWNLTARDPQDLTVVSDGWPQEDDGVVATHPYNPNLHYDHSITVATDSLGFVYVGGFGPLGDGTTTGFRIDVVAPDGTPSSEPLYLGPSEYECTELCVHQEFVEGVSHEYLYAMGFNVLPLGSSELPLPLILVKIDLATGAEVLAVPLGGPGVVVQGGNFESMAIGDDGSGNDALYIVWKDAVANVGVVSKFSTGGVLLMETTMGTGSAMPQTVATGEWNGQKWVWVAASNGIGRSDTNLVPASDSEAGKGCHNVDRVSGTTDYYRSMKVETGADGIARLYLCGLTQFTYYNYQDAYVGCYAMSSTGPSTQKLAEVLTGEIMIRFRRSS